MNITISKKTAKALDKAVWLMIATCNANRGGDKFEPNQPIMDNIGITIEELAGLNKMMEQIEKKYDIKKQKR